MAIVPGDKDHNKWPAVTRDRRCPKCDKPNRCRLSPDGMAGICWRSGTKEVWHDEKPAGGNGQHRRPDSKPTKLPPTFINAAAATAAASKWCKGTPAGSWNYPGGDFIVARFNLGDGSKQFFPMHKTAAGPWMIADPPGPLPLYRGDEFPAAEPVYVCEGEKATDCARAVGLPAVTSSHGSNAADKSDWTPLAGRDVVILPDNDDAGEKYAADVVAILSALNPPARVKIVRLPGLPPGGDIVEFDANIGGDPSATKDAVEKLAAAHPWIPSPGPMLVCMADVEPRQVSWLWPGRIPLGRITLLVGRPGEGKSFLTTDAAARVSTGTPWPDGMECPLGDVLIISGEDDPHDTIRPRLDAHRANVHRVHMLSMVRRIVQGGKLLEIMFTLADVAALEDALRRLPNCKLIIVDPIGSFLGGKVDGHRDNEVRAILAPIAKLAEKYGAAVLIVAHRRKSPGDVADDLALGSRAFTGIARACWHLSRDTENKNRRLLLPGKNNLAREGDGLAFTIAGEPASIQWETDPVTMSADDALAKENAGSRRGPEPKALAAATDWLKDELADLAEHPVEMLEKAAKAADHSWRTVQRASKGLGVLKHRASFGGGYVWRLPKPGMPDDGPSLPANPLENETTWQPGEQGEIL